MDLYFRENLLVFTYLYFLFVYFMSASFTTYFFGKVDDRKNRCKRVEIFDRPLKCFLLYFLYILNFLKLDLLWEVCLFLEFLWVFRCRKCQKVLIDISVILAWWSCHLDEQLTDKRLKRINELELLKGGHLSSFLINWCDLVF